MYDTELVQCRYCGNQYYIDSDLSRDYEDVECGECGHSCPVSISDTSDGDWE